VDDTVEMLRDEFPWVQIVASDINLGFGKGNNRAFQLARGEYVLILNPDTILLPGTLHTLLARIQDDHEIGIVGPILRSENGEPQWACARRSYNLLIAVAVDILRVTRLPLVGESILRTLVQSYDFGQVQDVEAISGAAMLVRRSALLYIGGFNEEYMHCGEDLALCYSLRKAGWRIQYLPTATVIHHSHASSRQAIARTTVEAMISNYLLLKRTRGSFEALTFRLMLWILMLPELCAKIACLCLRGPKQRGRLRACFQIILGVIRWQAPE